jgi:hypothetical protein
MTCLAAEHLLQARTGSGSRYCDHIYAVGDYAADELRFLSPEFEAANIDVVYNGIPAYEVTLAQKRAAQEKLRHYCENLLGHQPDYIFTRVTRLVRSKGLWRDLRVLDEIGKELRSQGKTAVFILLSTEVGRRRTCDIHHMEATYGYAPRGWPDLSGGGPTTRRFSNSMPAPQHHMIFINQFLLDGCAATACRTIWPRHRRTDVEFG